MTDHRHVRSGWCDIPGGMLLHPGVLMATALLWWNDHYGKRHYPGLITGKLSDVCGLMMFPLLLAGVAELWAACRGRTEWRRGARAVGWCALATGLVFVWVKTTTSGADAYRLFFAWRWMIPRMSRHAGTALPSVRFVADRTDLWALPALVVPVLLARRRETRR